MEEIWKDAVGYEGRYQVSNYGNVKSLNYRSSTNKAQIMKTRITKSGYVTVMLGKERNQPSVHVLVAKAFIPNPDNLPCVNHIDGNKTNNCVTNLEWVSQSENRIHAIKNGLATQYALRGRFRENHPASKVVVQYSASGELIKKWNCMSDAAASINGKVANITNVCKGRNKTYKGFIWRYDV